MKTKIFLFVLLIIVDIAIYIFLGLLQMVYDDNYLESEGDYWSWASMKNNEKIYYILLQSWNVINISVVIYIIYTLYKKFLHNK